jgi:hypothetical protein
MRALWCVARPTWGEVIGVALIAGIWLYVAITI